LNGQIVAGMNPSLYTANSPSMLIDGSSPAINHLNMDENQSILNDIISQIQQLHP